MTIVHGNHDVEFHWDVVKQEFGDARQDGEARRDDTLAADFAARIEFNPWFYYVGGVAYIEHGHQYDTLCSTEHVMAPLSPVDPRRIARCFSEVLLRWVVRPTRGVPEYGHDRMGVVDYVMLGVRMGAGGLVRLLSRYVLAVWSSCACAGPTCRRPRTRCARSTRGGWPRWRRPPASGSRSSARSPRCRCRR